MEKYIDVVVTWQRKDDRYNAAGKDASVFPLYDSAYR